MSDFLKLIGSKDTYEIPASFEDGKLKIAADDMETLLKQFPQQYTPTTYEYVGNFAEDPAIERYTYDRQVKYKVNGEAKYYYLRVTENIAMLADTYQSGVFPIPMASLNENVYVLTADGAIDHEHPVLTVTFTTDSETGKPKKAATIDFDLLENNTSFYTGSGDLKAYQAGDIYYNTENGVFKKVIETVNTITYSDPTTPSNPRLYQADNEEEGLVYKYYKIKFSDTDPYAEPTIGEEITKYTPGNLVDDQTYEQCGYIDENGQFIVLSTKEISYNYGATETVNITTRVWTTCDTADTSNIYINKYTGQVWSKTLEG